MTSEEDIKTLEQQVYQAPVLFEWEYIGCDGGKIMNYANWGFSLVIFLFFMFVAMSMDELPFKIGFIISGIIMFGYFKFLLGAKSCYHYKLTKLGIHYTQEQQIPEVAYTLVRGFAWVGIAVCLIALFVIGPLAFVGAGAFALMAIGMTNFKSKIDQNIILFSDANILFSLNNDVLLDIEPMNEIEFNFVGAVYATSLEKKKSIIAELVPLLGEVEVVDINRRNDKYKHPVFTSAQSEQ